MNNQTGKQLLTVSDVAEVLGLGVSTIWRQVKLGNIPDSVHIGGSTRWRKADIEELVRALGENGNDAGLADEADLAHGLAEDGHVL